MDKVAAGSGDMPMTILGLLSECQSSTRITLRSDYFPTRGTLRTMSYDRRSALAALENFQRVTKLKDYPWEMASKVGAGTLRRFRNGKTHSLNSETYDKLAAGASKLRGVEHTAAEIRGEIPIRLVVPIRSRVGAGEFVFPIDDDSNLGYAQVPPGVEAEECLQVDGDSMEPVYHHRDLLFPRAIRKPTELIGRIVAAQIKNGPRVVKILRKGTARGKWTLESVNPLHEPIKDCELETVAAIGAAIYHE